MRTRTLAALLFACAPCALAACGGDGDDPPQQVVTAPQSSYESAQKGTAARGLDLDPAALIAAYGSSGI